LVAAVLVVITLVALTPLFRNLPAAALGAVVIVTAIRLVNVGELERLWRVRTPTSCWRWSRSPVSWSSES
jgi:SulP family sulfate permease